MAALAAALKEMDIVQRATVGEFLSLKARVQDNDSQDLRAQLASLGDAVKRLEGQIKDLEMDFHNSRVASQTVSKRNEDSLGARLSKLEKIMGDESPPVAWLASLSSAAERVSLPSSPSAPHVLTLFPEERREEILVGDDPSKTTDSGLQKRLTLVVPQSQVLKSEGYMLSAKTVLSGLLLLRQYKDAHGGQYPYDVGPLMQPRVLNILWTSTERTKSQPPTIGHAKEWIEAMHDFIAKQGLNADDVIKNMPKFSNFVNESTRTATQLDLAVRLHAEETKDVYSHASDETKSSTMMGPRFLMAYLGNLPTALANAVKTTLSIANVNSVPKHITWAIVQTTVSTEMAKLWSENASSATLTFGIGEHYAPAKTAKPAPEGKSGSSDKSDKTKSPGKGATDAAEATLAALIAAGAAAAAASGGGPKESAALLAAFTAGRQWPGKQSASGQTGQTADAAGRAQSSAARRPGCVNCKDKTAANQHPRDCPLPCRAWQAGSCPLGDRCGQASTHVEQT